MDSEVTKVLLDILLAVAVAGIGWVGLYLKHRWGVEKYNKIMSQVKSTVQAAEIIGASLNWGGDAKKKYVVDKLAGVLKIDADELEVFIESAVQQLKAAGAELIMTSPTSKGGSKIVLASTHGSK